MPTLYYGDGACSLAPHIKLECISRPYEAVRVQYGSDELLTANAAGAVPTPSFSSLIECLAARR